MLRLIESNPRPVPDYERIYFDAFKRKTDELFLNPDNINIIKQAVFYGVKWANSNPGYLTAEDLFVMYTGIMDLIGSLTPAELITIFPIEKRYDGDKWGVKDYFYTMAELNKIGMGEKIGADMTLHLLWDYENPHLRVFAVRCMSALSALRRLQGQLGVAEEWCVINGIPTYTRYEDPETGDVTFVDNKACTVTRRANAIKTLPWNITITE